MSVSFLKSRWYSERMGEWATLARWGHFGQPVLLYPTAGGDAEESARFLMMNALGPLLEAGRIKVYSPDSIAGRAWFERRGSTGYRMALTNPFHQYVRHEVVPAIRLDCQDPEVTIWTAGASIGAFHAVATQCRFPDVFSRAVGMSGTYDLMRFIEADHPTPEFVVSSPLHFLPMLGGPHLDLLRTRHVHLATGAGRYENVGESWAMGHALGRAGVPNWVDDWGPDWHHDWVTWRAMLPKFLDGWTSGA